MSDQQAQELTPAEKQVIDHALYYWIRTAEPHLLASAEAGFEAGYAACLAARAPVPVERRDEWVCRECDWSSETRPPYGLCCSTEPHKNRTMVFRERPDEPTGTPDESDVRFPVKLNDAYTCQGRDRDGEAVTFNDLLSEGDRVASVTDEDGNHFAPFGVVVRREDGLWVELEPPTDGREHR